MSQPIIAIRRETPADAAAIAALTSHPAVFPILGTTPHLADNLVASLMGARAREDLGLCALIDNKVVAFGQLTRVNPSPRRAHAMALSLAVHPDYHRRGIGRHLSQELLDYADKWIMCTRIEIVVDVSNKKAIALYQSLGFIEEGVHKNYVLTDGKYCDVIAMARIRPQ